ncbi:hypothetical protein FNV43_RR02006 [Rhamnella rubrinervis]|uniref:GTP-binding nuclear protein n=1 Tax=Rhamnella rubrinervis TaxID=2594499 RepID=A0A8K0HTA7_9ROSA|nr:hypothetical protein FNV43_RR02006 [Rhamnella rubrinervis]
MERQEQASQPQQPGKGTTFLRTGVGILSVPYALSQGGWIKTYPDIGQAAYGPKGRALVSAFIYLELFAVAVEFLILEGDTLCMLFRGTSFRVGALNIERRVAFVLLTSFVILPTMWLKNLGVFAYVSAGGCILSVAGAMLLPCMCYLKINKVARKFGFELVVIIRIIVTGSFIGVEPFVASVPSSLAQPVFKNKRPRPPTEIQSPGTSHDMTQLSVSGEGRRGDNHAGCQHLQLDILEEMFDIKGQLHPQNKWEIVFAYDEGDMMLLGDDLWPIHGRCTIIMFDVTSCLTYKNVPTWHRDLCRVFENIPIVLCGNKVDVKNRQVKVKQVTFHRKKNLQYYDISA